MNTTEGYCRQKNGQRKVQMPARMDSSQSGIVFEYVVFKYKDFSNVSMEKKAIRTFKTALRNTRKEQKVSLQELGLRIDSDASHIFKIERGLDISLSTMLRLAEALQVSVTFGGYTICADPATKKRPRKKKGLNL